MHRYHAAEKYPSFLTVVKAVFAGKKGKLKTILRDIKSAHSANSHLPLYHTIIRFCKQNNIPIIVHTKQTKELIERKMNHHCVFDHPLFFYSQDHIDLMRTTYTRKEFCENLSLDPTKKYIGIFGFISKYKGFETIIQALSFLPNDYELLIFGAQHPHSFKLDESINPYIDILIKLIKKLKLENRVKFFRALNDDEFLKFMIGCDFNVLPYLEVNQGGSAIAALSLETNSNTIFSQNNAFFELEKYAINGFKMFTMGNYLELAHAITSYRKENYESNLQAYHVNYNIKTSSELYKNLLVP
jgi:glycosyltransferase involved in cell wall biosynthesis